MYPDEIKTEHIDFRKEFEDLYNLYKKMYQRKQRRII